MPHHIRRRDFTLALPLGAVSAALLGTAHGLLAETPSTGGTGASVPEFYPRQDPLRAEKVVGLAHRDLKGVQELVDAQPSLANAAVDLGFGDWETALGAASHTGQREIAEYLISKGARPDLFTFAMLGNLEAIRAMVGNNPALRAIRGPHGISLLSHAKAGGDAAKAVTEYLESFGDANPAYLNTPLSEQDKKALLGVYAFGPGERDRLEIGEGMGGITIKRTGGSPRRLFHQGDHIFHPAGAPTVKIAFNHAAVPMTLTVAESLLSVVASRV